MPRPGPRTTYKYSDRFKATAVRLSQLRGVSAQEVAESLLERLLKSHLKRSGKSLVLAKIRSPSEVSRCSNCGMITVSGMVQPSVGISRNLRRWCDGSNRSTSITVTWYASTCTHFLPYRSYYPPFLVSHRRQQRSMRQKLYCASPSIKTRAGAVS